jgi:hypothetical protein
MELVVRGEACCRRDYNNYTRLSLAVMARVAVTSESVGLVAVKLDAPVSYTWWVFNPPRS